MVTQNNFWHLQRATQENLAKTWTLDHGFRVIYIKKYKQKCQILTSNKNEEQTKPRKKITSSMAKSTMCSVSTNLVQGVNLCNLILDCLKTIGLYRGKHLLLLRYSLDLAKILICLNLQKGGEEEEEEEEEDVTNHKSKQGLKQEVTSRTVIRPPMLFVAHREKEDCFVM